MAKITIGDVVEWFSEKGLRKIDGLFLAVELKTGKKTIEVRGIIKISENQIHLLVEDGNNIRKRIKYKSYDAGTKVVSLL